MGDTNNPLLCGVREATRLCGVSKSTLQRMVNSGQFPPPIKMRRRTVWNRRVIEEWLQEQQELAEVATV